MVNSSYRLSLAAATTVAACQKAYEGEVAACAQRLRQADRENYRALLAAQEVDLWIEAENRAQVVNAGHHSYGSLIVRRKIY
ncbi:hypothetical protein [Limosilactobacillus antri]|uniref:hypothetical protein n=1 Tax=Limosilactobacillus antri TaxID=227943 RepID=UPI001F591B87|nr:hypothetical protein [Limosilactobacillus antri]